jgi:hypothetical protein
MFSESPPSLRVVIPQYSEPRKSLAILSGINSVTDMADPPLPEIK